MGEDERHHLRMLVVDEPGELLRVSLLQGIDAGESGAQRFDQPVEHPGGSLLSEGAHEQLACVFQSPLEHVVVGHGHVEELLQDQFGLLIADRSHARHLAADLLHLILPEVLEDLGADLVAERNQQDGRFLCTGQRFWEDLGVEGHGKGAECGHTGTLAKPRGPLLTGSADRPEALNQWNTGGRRKVRCMRVLGVSYSYRKAMSGSMRAARRPGM